MRDVKAFPHALRLLREERGYAQLQVAEVLGVDSSVVSAWEAGDRWPPFERFFQLADALDLDLGDYDRALELIGGGPRPPRPAAEPPPPDAGELAALLLGPEPGLPVGPGEAILFKLLEAAVELAALLRRVRDEGPAGNS